MRLNPLPALRSNALARQFATFFGVGAIAAIAHYGLLVSLVEGYRMDPIRAALAGYVAGGIVSYILNRRHTYASDRPHRQATWRFGVVAAVGFGLTWIGMALLVRGLGLPYLVGQLVTTGIVLFWSFAAHKLWTFREPNVPLP
jgi:putative flippase GtrA